MIDKNNNLDSNVAMWSKSKYFRPKPLGKQGNANYVKERGFYRELMNGFLANLEKALLDGHTVILPAYMGRLFIQGTKLTTPYWNGVAMQEKLREGIAKEDIVPIRFSPEKNDGIHYKLTYSFNGGYNYTQYFKVRASLQFKKKLQTRVDAGQTYFVKTHYSKRLNFIDNKLVKKVVENEQVRENTADITIEKDGW